MPLKILYSRSPPPRISPPLHRKMSCPPTSSLANSTFINACIISNVTAANTLITTALQTCCGPTNVFTTGCYTYCNITSAADQEFWTLCLMNNLQPQDVLSLDASCANPPDNATAVGRIATTWSPPDVTFTQTYTDELGNAISTATVDPGMLTSSGVNATVSQTQTQDQTQTQTQAQAVLGEATGLSSVGPKNAGNSTSSSSSSSGYSVVLSITSSQPKPTSVSSSPSPSPTTSKSKAADGVRVSRFGAIALVGLVMCWNLGIM